jgi:hypothetical protein
VFFCRFWLKKNPIQMMKFGAIKSPVNSASKVTNQIAFFSTILCLIKKKLYVRLDLKGEACPWLPAGAIC